MNCVIIVGRFSTIFNVWDENKNSEMCNKVGHVTSLSGRYQRRNLPKCRTDKDD